MAIEQRFIVDTFQTQYHSFIHCLLFYLHICAFSLLWLHKSCCLYTVVWIFGEFFEFSPKFTPPFHRIMWIYRCGVYRKPMCESPVDKHLYISTIQVIKIRWFQCVILLCGLSSIYLCIWFFLSLCALMFACKHIIPLIDPLKFNIHTLPEQ